MIIDRDFAIRYGDAGWAAGLFEGEGYICFSPKSSVKIGIEMTDFDVLERFVEIIGVGKISPRKIRESRHKQRYIWEVRTHMDVKNVLELLLPWLGTRRKTRAGQAITRIAEIRPTRPYKPRDAMQQGE